MTVETRPAAAAARLPGRASRLLAPATLGSMALLVWAALAWAPEDLEQGPPQRIFYIHVPSAWVAFLAFAVVFGASIALLATGKQRYDQIAAASAEVGVVFTTAVLITGPLWARPTWGVYWSWDPRLTSVFILWLIYLSYLSLRSYLPDPARRARFSAVLGIVGFADVPIIYLSVRWWRALHPAPVVLVRGGPQMPGEMLAVLMFGLATFTLLYLLLLRIRIDVQRAREIRGAA
ncbi:MAG: cytochrome c biogenesis protein CcsA [Acidobacteria bacterium]|nr:cytochrome c biogenesis protein CcsA [Acidobacteriota bacterium]